MERRRFRTELGEIWVRGEIDRFSPARPLLLLINGSYAPADSYNALIKALPEADVLLAHLPGNHCPKLAEVSIAAFARAFDEAIQRIGRPVIILGISTGGLVAFGLRAAWIKGILVLDPPLDTTNLWPLTARFRERGAVDPDTAEFALNIFGIGADDVSPRDYSSLLSGVMTPAMCLLGEIELEPERELPEMPSLASEAARAALCDHREIGVYIIPGVGHEIGRLEGRYVLAALRKLL